MTSIVPQSILDALTDVAMPRLANERPPKEFVTARGVRPAGAPRRGARPGQRRGRLRAAVELKRRDVDVVVASQSAFGGTSACSGSDKQTLHTANTARTRRRFRALADALGAGGAMDEDTAYVEAVGSVRALVVAAIHGSADPAGSARRRAALSDRSRRGRPRDQLRPANLPADGPGADARSDPPGHPDLQSHHGRSAAGRTGAKPRAVGVLAMPPKSATARQSVWVRGVSLPTRSSSRPAAPASSTATASIPGTASDPSALRWKLESKRSISPRASSGSARRATISRGICRAPTCSACPTSSRATREGHERNFLADYYRTTQELASNIFRKGYQWPFHATRMLDFGSSLFDLAVFRETQAGRKVFMDFNRNPLAGPRRRRVQSRPA